MIHFGTHNIPKGRNGGLQYDLSGMAQANIDLGMPKKTIATVSTHRSQIVTEWWRQICPDDTA